MSLPKARLVRASIFVDWHNTESNSRQLFSVRHIRYFQNVIFRVQEEVAKILKRRDSTVKYRAALRLYHGWHLEDRPTECRGRFEAIIGLNHSREQLDLFRSHQKLSLEMNSHLTPQAIHSLIHYGLKVRRWLTPRSPAICFICSAQAWRT